MKFLLFLYLIIVIPSSNCALQQSSNRIRSILSKTLSCASPTRALTTSSTLTPAQNTDASFFPLEDRKSVQKAYYAKLEALPWGKLAQQWISNLNELDQQHHQAFLNFTGFTEKDWQLCLEETTTRGKERQDYLLAMADERPKTAGHITGKMRDLIDRILKQCCINPSHVNLVSYDPQLYSNHSAMAVVSPNTIGLHHSAINNDPILLEYWLSHECIHLMHNEYIQYFAQLVAGYSLGHVSVDCKQNNKPVYVNTRYKELNYQHRQVLEQRADILALLLNPAYAKQGYIAYVSKKGSYEETHPPYFKRALYHKKLYNQMLNHKPWYALWPSSIVRGN